MNHPTNNASNRSSARLAIFLLLLLAAIIGPIDTSFVALAAEPQKIDSTEPTDSANAGKSSIVVTNAGDLLIGRIEARGERVFVTTDDGGIVGIPRQRVVSIADNLGAARAAWHRHQRQSGVFQHETQATWSAEKGSKEDQKIRPVLEVKDQPPQDPGASAKRRANDHIRSPRNPSISSVDRSLGQSRDTDSESNPLTLAEFKKTIQPLLLNRCGNTHCHGVRRDGTCRGAFRLLHGVARQTPSHTQTIKNLKETRRFIDFTSPSDSALLGHALRLHGGGINPTLDSKHRVILTAWVHESADRDNRSPKSQESNVTANNSTTMTDPFDPEIFNRRHRAPENSNPN